LITILVSALRFLRSLPPLLVGLLYYAAFLTFLAPAGFAVLRCRFLVYISLPRALFRRAAFVLKKRVAFTAFYRGVLRLRFPLRATTYTLRACHTAFSAFCRSLVNVYGSLRTAFVPRSPRMDSLPFHRTPPPPTYPRTLRVRVALPAVTRLRLHTVLRSRSPFAHSFGAFYSGTTVSAPFCADSLCKDKTRFLRSGFLTHGQILPFVSLCRLTLRYVCVHRRTFCVCVFHVRFRSPGCRVHVCRCVRAPRFVYILPFAAVFSLRFAVRTVRSFARCVSGTFRSFSLLPVTLTTFCHFLLFGRRSLVAHVCFCDATLHLHFGYAFTLKL